MGLGLFYNDTVTLFNRFLDPDTGEERYYPTLLKQVNLVEKDKADMSKNGVTTSDAATLYFHEDYSDKQYVSPKCWEALSDKEKYLTFKPTEDFFVRGDQTDVDFPADNMYEWMRDNFDSVYKITRIDKYEDILPHFEVGGV